MANNVENVNVENTNASVDGADAEKGIGKEEKKPKGKAKDKTRAGDELVEVTLFKDGNKYQDDVFVAVNGERCQIKRGIPVKIKKKFAMAYERSQKQDMLAAHTMSQLHQEFTSGVASGVV